MDRKLAIGKVAKPVRVEPLRDKRGRIIERYSQYKDVDLPKEREKRDETLFFLDNNKFAPGKFVEDALKTYVGTPTSIFQMGMNKLVSSDSREREQGYRILYCLATEGQHCYSCEARYLVGECIMVGRGTGKGTDAMSATHWFLSVRATPEGWPRGLEKTLENTQAHAQYLLGQLYEHGDSRFEVEANPDRGLIWYARAAGRGHPMAALAVAELLASSSDSPGACLHPRPPEPNFQLLGLRQASTVASGCGAVAVRWAGGARRQGLLASGGRLVYLTDRSGSHGGLGGQGGQGKGKGDEADSWGRQSSAERWARAHRFFSDVLELTSSLSPHNFDQSTQSTQSAQPQPPHQHHRQSQGQNQSQSQSQSQGQGQAEGSSSRRKTLLWTPSLSAVLAFSHTVSPTGKQHQAREDSTRERQTDAEAAASLLRDARARALMGLALLSQEGRGCAQDVPRAVRLVKEAVQTLDSTPAIFLLALYLHFGRGIPQNCDMALKLYSTFLERGESPTSGTAVSTPASRTSVMTPDTPDSTTSRFSTAAASALARNDRTSARSTSSGFPSLPNSSRASSTRTGSRDSAGGSRRSTVLDGDACASHPEWRELALRLRSHCKGTIRAQEENFIRARTRIQGAR